MGKAIGGQQSAERKGVPLTEEILMDTLNLCQRWQIGGLTKVLQEKLSSMVTVSNVEDLLVSAVLQHSQLLRQACLEVARNSTELRQKFYAGEVRESIQPELERLFGAASSQAPEKKRRRKRF